MRIRNQIISRLIMVWILVFSGIFISNIAHSHDIFESNEEAVATIEALTIATIESGESNFGSFSIAGDPNFYLVGVNFIDVDFEIFFSVEGEFGFEDYTFNSTEEFFNFLEARFLELAPQFQELLEDLEKQIEKAKQVVTANVITDTPGGPMDESFSQIALGRSVFQRPYADLGGAMEDSGEGGETAATTAATLADQLATVLRYTRFHFKDVEGNIYGVTLGAQRETENMRYGILIPYDRIDYDGTSNDGDSFTATPFLQFIVVRDPVIVAVGPYLFFNYTFLNDADNFDMYGAGFSGSVEKRWQNIWARIGVAGEYIDADINHPENDVVRMRYGATVGFPVIPDQVELRLFGIGTIADDKFLGGDKEFGSLGGEIAANITEAFAMTFGYLSSVGHEHLSSHTGYIGGIFLLP